MDTPKLWYIRGVDLFRDNPQLVDELRSEGRLERWGHRAQIAHREEPGEIHVVMNGDVELYDPFYETSLRLGRSGLFGVIAERSGETRLKALDDTIIAALPRPRFDELAGRSLGRMEANLGIVRRRRLAVPVSMLLYTPPRSRLARVLVHLIEEYGVVDDETGILEMVPNHKTLARLSGLADRTVSDIFETLTKDRVIEVGSTKLVVPSLDEVRNLAIR